MPVFKKIHRAGLCSPTGDVSARCFKTPRRIDLRRETWTIIDDDVTCGACRAVREEWERSALDGEAGKGP